MDWVGLICWLLWSIEGSRLGRERERVLFAGSSESVWDYTLSAVGLASSNVQKQSKFRNKVHCISNINYLLNNLQAQVTITPCTVCQVQSELDSWPYKQVYVLPDMLYFFIRTQNVCSVCFSFTLYWLKLTQSKLRYIYRKPPTHTPPIYTHVMMMMTAASVCFSLEDLHTPKQLAL